MLRFEISKQAQRSIQKINKSSPKLLNSITFQISQLCMNPMPYNAKKLTNSNFWRIRVGKYRIIYRFNNTKVFITIIDKRDKVYSFRLLGNNH